MSRLALNLLRSNSAASNTIIEDFAAWQAGDDPRASERVVTDLTEFLYPIVLRMLGNVHMAEDVVQQTLLRLHEVRDKLIVTSMGLHGVARVIAKRIVLDHYRHIRVTRIRPSSIEDASALSGGLAPDTELQRAEVQEAVRRAIEVLPADQRDVIRLRYYEGLHFNEIAALLKLPPGTIASRDFAARHKLRTKLTDMFTT